MLRPLPRTTGGGNHQECLAQCHELGDGRLSTHLRTRTIRVAAIKFRPPGQRQTGDVSNLGKRDVRPRREKVTRGNNGHLPLDKQFFGVEAVEIIDRPVHDRHIGPAPAQQRRLLPDLTQQYLDIRNVTALGGLPEQPLQYLEGRTGFRCKHQWSPRTSGSPGPMSRSLNRVDHRVRLAHQDPSGVGELDATTVALEQLHAEPRLELLDRTGQRRLRDAEQVCRPTEVQLVGNGEEIAEVTRLQIGHIHHATSILTGYHRRGDRSWTPRVHAAKIEE